MPETLKFNAHYHYDPGEIGIEIPILLLARGRQVRLNAKIDTGAQFCVFQRDYAEQLEIAIESGEKRTIHTAGGTTFTVYGHEVQLSCLDWTFETVVYFAEAAGFNRNVVGRTGWLQQFRLGLIDHESILYLSHHDD